MLTVNGGRRLENGYCSPNGIEIAVYQAEGEVFVTSVDGSLTKRHADNTPENEERFCSSCRMVHQWIMPVETRQVNGVFSSEKKNQNKEEALFLCSTLIKEDTFING